MGTMLQSSDVTMDAFQGLEGCNEILNVTRPDVISGIHDAYLDAGADIIETNTFGANLPALTDYGIASRASELASAATKLAREAADKRTDKPRYVVGSIGPGTGRSCPRRSMASAAYSSGRPSRCGYGTCWPSEACAASGSYSCGPSCEVPEA